VNGIDPRLRKHLICPTCRGELEDVADGLRCATEHKTYPVVDGVPHLVAELAKRDISPGR